MHKIVYSVLFPTKKKTNGRAPRLENNYRRDTLSQWRSLGAHVLPASALEKKLRQYLTPQRANRRRGSSRLLSLSLSFSYTSPGYIIIYASDFFRQALSRECFNMFAVQEAEAREKKRNTNEDHTSMSRSSSNAFSRVFFSSSLSPVERISYDDRASIWPRHANAHSSNMVIEFVIECSCARCHVAGNH